MADMSHVPACENCAVFFGLLTRRNRCRECGGVFCGKCTSYALPNQPKARACRSCSAKANQAAGGGGAAQIAPPPEDEPLLSLVAKSTAIGEGLNSRIVVGLFGASQTGKTALAQRFVQDGFPEEWDATIEDVYQKEVHVDDSTFWLEIHDTAGMEELAESRDAPMDKCEVFVLVYSVQDRTSLTALEAFHKSITERQLAKGKKPGEFVFILAANKADDAKPRQATVDDGQQMAKKLKAQYIETSAKDRQNVVETFHGAIICWLEATGLLQPSSPSGSSVASGGSGSGSGIRGAAPPAAAPTPAAAIAPAGATPAVAAASPRGVIAPAKGGVAPSVTTSGVLTKGGGGLMSSAKKRLFVLEGTCLSYYEKQDGAQLGRLDLRGAAFIAGAQPLQFKLAGPYLNTDKKDKTYVLSADSQADYDKWKFAIEEAVRGTS